MRTGQGLRAPAKSRRFRWRPVVKFTAQPNVWGDGGFGVRDFDFMSIRIRPDRSVGAVEQIVSFELKGLLQ